MDRPVREGARDLGFLDEGSTREVTVRAVAVSVVVMYQARTAAPVGPLDRHGQ
jgi:hypothetical protein